MPTRTERRLRGTENDRDEREREALQRHIVDEILTLKCPRQECRQAYVDFNGCAALRCARCPAAFCGWCLQDCGTDAHAHVRSCPEKPEGCDPYFPSPRARFDEHWVRRKSALVAEELRRARPAVRALVCRALHVELDELGYEGEWYA